MIYRSIRSLHCLDLNKLEPLPLLPFQLGQLLCVPRTLSYPRSKLVEKEWEETHDGSKDAEDSAGPLVSNYVVGYEECREINI